MAGISGNKAYLVAAKQTGKGTPNTTFTEKLYFSGGNISPTHGTDQLAETDATRQAGDPYVTVTGVEGAPEVYLRDASIHHILEWALGTSVHSGSTPNYTHTITPGTALPYITLGKGQGDLLYEQFQDCKISELTISADAGSPLTAAMSVIGRSSVRQAAEWGALPTGPDSTNPVYNFNDATVTLAGGATSLVSSFECTISNNVTAQQTDDSVPYDVADGQLEVTLGFNMLFENLTEYNKFHYGGASGTTQSPTIYSTAANFSFSKGANNQVNFDFPKIAYEEFPVEPDAGGDPVTVAVRARCMRNASGFLTATVKNQTAT